MSIYGDVAGQDPADQPSGYAPTRDHPLDAHARTTFVSDAGERGLDRATGVDHRHARSIVAVGVDVAHDLYPIGGVPRGRRDD